MPPTTTLAHLGFDAKIVERLPKEVLHLTKADLLSLGGWGTTKLTAAAAKVTPHEVASIKSVLGDSLAHPGGLVAGDINCCSCCCPCCCAAAVTSAKVPARRLN